MRSALGKGLTQLMGEQADAAPSELPVSAIHPNPNQPRQQFEEGALNELAESIRTFGVIQPLLVRPVREGAYEIIAGERRWRAAQRAGLTSVPAIVRSADAKATLEMALIENVQREDISALECAFAYRRLADEFGLKQDDIAQRVGKSRTAVANTMRILRLPRRVLDGLAAGAITEGHARALLTADGASAQEALFDRIIAKNLNVRDVEKLARPETSAPRARRADMSEVDPTWRSVRDAIGEKFGAPVRLEGGLNGGRITLEFYSEEDLARIVELMGIEL